MDLMIEAKDKEQAVFELRRKWNVEGGIPSDWVLRGEKMDEIREVPTYEGRNVVYEEGCEWRFKPPIKMPVKVSKVLEKLDKEKLKVEKQKEKIGEDDKSELKRIEMEFIKIEEDRKKVLEDWEREKRIKWGLEKKVDEQGNDITPAPTPKRKSKAKKKAVVKDEDEEGEEQKAEDMEEDIPAIISPRATPRRAASGRGRKSYAEMEEEGIEDDQEDENVSSAEELPKKPKSRGRKKTSETEIENGDVPALVPQSNGAGSSVTQNVYGGGKRRKAGNGIKSEVEDIEGLTETVVRNAERTARSRKLQT
jgi:hypothetical protein